MVWFKNKKSPFLFVFKFILFIDEFISNIIFTVHQLVWLALKNVLSQFDSFSDFYVFDFCEKYAHLKPKQFSIFKYLN